MIELPAHYVTLARMKIGIVRDLRNHTNWGARTTTPTLSQLLREISDDVDHLMIPPGLVTGTVLPRKVAQGIWYRRQYLPMNICLEIESFFGAKFGLFEEELNPRVIVDTILRNRNKCQELSDLFDRTMRCDLVVLDGDGDFILSKNRHEMTSGLSIIELAKELGKKTVLLNTMIADPIHKERDREITEILVRSLRRCDRIALRDRESIDVLKTIDPELNPVLIPDVLFCRYPYFSREQIEKNLPRNGNYLLPQGEMADKYFDRLNFEKEYICVTGGAGAAKNHLAVEAYTRLINRLSELDLPIYLTPTCSGDRFLYTVSDITGVPIIPASIPAFAGGLILANAKLFVSGRYHPSILASFGGTPTIFLEADSHKISSLQPLLGYENHRAFSATPSTDECDEIRSVAVEYLNDGSELRSRILVHAEARYRETSQYLDLIKSV